MNNEDRKWALRWWRSLSKDKQVEIANEHFPHMPAQAISASTMRVTQIWKREGRPCGTL